MLIAAWRQTIHAACVHSPFNLCFFPTLPQSICMSHKHDEQLRRPYFSFKQIGSPSELFYLYSGCPEVDLSNSCSLKHQSRFLLWFAYHGGITNIKTEEKPCTAQLGSKTNVLLHSTSSSFLVHNTRMRLAASAQKIKETVKKQFSTTMYYLQTFHH